MSKSTPRSLVQLKCSAALKLLSSIGNFGGLSFYRARYLSCGIETLRRHVKNKCVRIVMYKISCRRICRSHLILNWLQCHNNNDLCFNVVSGIVDNGFFSFAWGATHRIEDNVMFRQSKCFITNCVEQISFFFQLGFGLLIFIVRGTTLGIIGSLFSIAPGPRHLVRVFCVRVYLSLLRCSAFWTFKLLVHMHFGHSNCWLTSIRCSFEKKNKDFPVLRQFWLGWFCVEKIA